MRHMSQSADTTSKFSSMPVQFISLEERVENHGREDPQGIFPADCSRMRELNVALDIMRRGFDEVVSVVGIDDFVGVGRVAPSELKG